MATLGGLFPPSAKREHIESQLKPGSVVRLEVKLSTITKPKFLILAASDDPDHLLFVVNSEINQFILNRPHLLQCQVIIDAKSHGFLSYDSNISCHEVLVIKREDIVKALMVDPSALKGSISQNVQDQIIAAVKIAKTLDNDKKNRIISSLSN